MKTKQSIALLLTLALTSNLTDAQEAPDPLAHGDPYVPVGTLAVNPIFVQTGVKPNLDWGIEYPTVVDDIAVVGGSGSTVTTRDVTVEIRVSGVSFDCSSDGKEMPVAVWVRVGGEGTYWSLVFYGDAYDVNPSKVLYKNNNVPAGSSIDIAARGISASGSWYPVVWTIDGGDTLAVLGNGESIPDHLITEFGTGDVESYTSAVLSDDYMTVEVGPKDLVYMFELSATDPVEPCFDCQDVIVSVQYGTKNNNGHGNNVDGVDVSNPGGGLGGPNGISDPSGNVDDEMKSFKVK